VGDAGRYVQDASGRRRFSETVPGADGGGLGGSPVPVPVLPSAGPVPDRNAGSRGATGRILGASDSVRRHHGPQETRGNQGSMTRPPSQKTEGLPRLVPS